MPSFKEWFLMYIPENEIDDFAEWAFGEGYKDTAGPDLMKKWNSRHSELYEIKPKDQVNPGIQKMAELWEQNKRIS